jgi:hypothetical protein
MKATIYAVLCYHTRVVTRPRQRRLCGMTEAFLPLPGVSLQLSVEMHKNETQERKCRVHVEVIASVVTYCQAISISISFTIPPTPESLLLLHLYDLLTISTMHRIAYQVG